jgi:hypothetical protein
MRTAVKKLLILLALSGAAFLFPTCSTITTCRCCLWTANQLCEQRPEMDPQGWYEFSAWGPIHIGHARRGTQERRAWEFEDVGALRFRFGLFLQGITLDVLQAKPEWHMVLEGWAWLNLVPAIAAWLLWLWWASRRPRPARCAPGKPANQGNPSDDLQPPAGMTRWRRIGVMALGPPVVSGAMLVLFMPAFVSTKAGTPFLQVVPVALLLALLFGVPPSALFAVVMEVAFARGLDPRRWPAALLATGLGGTTGVALGEFVANAFHGMQTGGIRMFLVAAGATAGLVVALAIRAGSSTTKRTATVD